MDRMLYLNGFLNENEVDLTKIDPRIKRDPTLKNPRKKLGSIKKKNEKDDYSWMDDHKAREMFRNENEEVNEANPIKAVKRHFDKKRWRNPDPISDKYDAVKNSNYDDNWGEPDTTYRPLTKRNHDTEQRWNKAAEMKQMKDMAKRKRMAKGNKKSASRQPSIPRRGSK